MSEKEKIILGIDPSLQSSGIAVINGETGEVINYGNLPIKPKDLNGDEILKIHYIATTILKIAKEYNVTHVAIENSYVGVNSRTGLTLARLYGAITSFLIENDIRLIYTYTPSNWRKIATGIGNKTKEGMYDWVCNHMVSKEELGEFCTKGKNKNDDICDALGIAYALYKRLNKEQ